MTEEKHVLVDINTLGLWGKTSFAITIPIELVNEMGLEKGQKMKIYWNCKDKIIITPRGAIK